MRISDWSSDVCSSDLAADPIWVSANAARDTARYTRGLLYVGAIGILVGFATIGAAVWAGQHAKRAAIEAGKSANAAIASHEAFVSADRKSVVSGKRVSVRVDIGGRRSIKQKKRNTGDTKKK